MYRVSFKNVERFLSYVVRLKFSDDADDDDDKRITKETHFFFEKQLKMKTFSKSSAADFIYGQVN